MDDFKKLKTQIGQLDGNAAGGNGYTGDRDAVS